MLNLKKIGALTIKNFAFKVRTWELKSIRSLDIFDIIGCDLRVEFKNNKIFRILSVKSFSNFFSKFITDNCRFFFESIYFQRIEYPIIRVKNYYISVTWFNLFLFLKIYLKFLGNFFNKVNIFSLVGNFLDLKVLVFFKRLLNRLGSNIMLNNFFFKRVDGFFENYIKEEELKNYLFLKKKNIILFSFYPRFEFPTFYRVIKKIKDKINIINILKNGNKKEQNLGNSFYIFLYLFFGNLNLVKNIMLKADDFIFFFGVNFFQNFTINTFFNLRFILEDNRLFFNNIGNFLWVNGSLSYYYNLPYLSSMNKQELGLLKNFYGKLGFLNSYKSLSKSKKNILILIESGEIEFKNIFNLIIFQGLNMDSFFFFSDVVLPSYSYIENSQFFFNFFKKIKKAEKILTDKKNLVITSNVFFNSFFNYFFNYNFYKFNFIIKKNEINIRSSLKVFLLKKLIKEVLGLPSLRVFFWWSSDVGKFLNIKIINIFSFYLKFFSIFILKKNKEIKLENIKIISFKFFYNIFKISNYTRFSKSLVVSSIKSRFLNFK